MHIQLCRKGHGLLLDFGGAAAITNQPEPGLRRLGDEHCPEMLIKLSTSTRLQKG